ncbi:MAG: homoserine dehydrogenase [Chromatiales bacterium]|jgi:aspartate-semialdehyde dehydrogenase
MALKIAIVGLGRVGERFLDQMLEKSDIGIQILAAAELNETEGRKKAEANDIPILGLKQIVELNEHLDILFDLTGHDGTRKQLRELMMDVGNTHTVIAPETIAYLIWGLTTDQPLPDVHANKGY